MLEFDVSCEVRGKALTAYNSKGDICVEPCPDCLKTAHDEGFDSGRDTGYSEGYDEGFREGGKA